MWLRLFFVLSLPVPVPRESDAEKPVSIWQPLLTALLWCRAAIRVSSWRAEWLVDDQHSARSVHAATSSVTCTCMDRKLMVMHPRTAYYRKRGSASYIVREWLLWEGERERERERETPVTSFDITLKSRVIMHMITSTARRPNASTRSEPVECSCIRQGAWCLSARAAGNGGVIYEWR